MSEALDIVRRILEVYSGDMAAKFRDPDQLAAAREITDPLFAEDVVFVVPGETGEPVAFPSGEMRGVQSLVALWSEWFDVFESVLQEVGELKLLPDGRVMGMAETTVRLSTGDSMVVPGASLWEVVDGKVVWLAWGPNVPAIRAAAGLDPQHSP